MPFLANLRFAWRTLQLNRVARSSPEAIHAVQQKRFRKLYDYARANSPFYCKLYRHNPKELHALPVTNKSMLMENFDQSVTDPQLHLDDLKVFLDDPANIGKYFRDKYMISHTSGSSGQPMVLVQTPKEIELLFTLQASRGNDIHMSLGTALRRHFDRARLAVVTLKRGLYPSAAAFEYMPPQAQNYINLLRLSGMDDDVISELNHFQPTHLTAYASMLHMLADAVDRRELELSSLQQIVNNSEQLTAGSRQRFEETFKVRVLDNYATGECPFLSNGCRAMPGMHVNADWAIFEVVDEENRPVPPGVAGARVLITNLANKVQPIIRYVVEDVVTMADEPCTCGSQLPRIARIEGRASERFWVEREGKVAEVTPIVFQHAMEHQLSLREYQIVQTDRNRFQINVQSLPGKTVNLGEVRESVGRELREYRLNDAVEFEVREVDELAPNPKTNKFSRVISLGKPEATVPEPVGLHG